MKYFFYSVLLIHILLLSCKNGNTKIDVLTIDQLEKAVSKDKSKMILIDVYTDWCHWCKVMDAKTFSDPKIIKYLHDNYHVVKFNAEQKEDILYNGKIYKYIATGRSGTNELAIELMSGRLSYPTLIFMDSNLSVLRISPGYKDPDELMLELKDFR